MGSRDEHTLRSFLDAESYDGPALIIASCHCIAHGIEMRTGMQHQKGAVDSGQWLLYRFAPRRSARRESPLQRDSSAPNTKFLDFAGSEARFNSVAWNPE